MLPAIVSAAYVYSTNQSAVQVTYADASTAIVYPNEFTNLRTQQLNQWVYRGGQIAPYIPPDYPKPGPPAWITCVPSATQGPLTTGGDLTNWEVADSFNLSLTSGTSISLLPYRAYLISVTLNPLDFSNPTAGAANFELVNADTNVPLHPGSDFVAIPTTNTDVASVTTSISLVYNPTEEVPVKVRCTNAVGTFRAGGFGSWTITELVDESLYAEKIGPAGPVGPKGPAGPQGSAGPIGPVGPTGTQGPQGAIGPVGPQGQPGPGFDFLGTVANVVNLPTPASQGDAYLVTATNTLWIYDGAGNWNDAGPIQGPQGVAGPQGPIGPAGATGAQGPTGATGPAGPQGTQGSQGSPGPTGATGATGSAGATGATGPQGPAGPQGPVGPAGSGARVMVVGINLQTNGQGLPINTKSFTLPANITGFTVVVSGVGIPVGSNPAGQTLSIRAQCPSLTVNGSNSGWSISAGGTATLVMGWDGVSTPVAPGDAFTVTITAQSAILYDSNYIAQAVVTYW